ncbi:MAG: phosphatase PAP2 family protein [Leeuwenhoekiella sp.]
METLNELDHQLYLYLNNLGGSFWDPFWLFITDKWSSIPFYAVLLLLLIRTFSWKTLGFTLLAVALLITCTDQLANVFKYGFERLRPCRQEGVAAQARFIAVRCGHYGFFSAHAASSMALAVFMGRIFRHKLRWLIWVLFLWAITVAYSRIYVGVHYPGDVLVGMLIGAGIGILIYYIYNLAAAKWNFYKSD